MKILGLIGGIACGKSTVASELATLGAVVLDADLAAHEVISLPGVQQALVSRWGENIVNSSGETNRAAVAKIVFSDQQNNRSELQFLEETLHPRIRERFEGKLAEAATEGAEVAVIDAPMLIEAGWENLCDCLIFVDSPRSDRLERAKLRNWTEAEFAKREGFQMLIAEKRNRSTHTLANSGTLASLRDQVRAFWDSLESSGGKT